MVNPGLAPRLFDPLRRAPHYRYLARARARSDQKNKSKPLIKQKGKYYIASFHNAPENRKINHILFSIYLI